MQICHLVRQWIFSQSKFLSLPRLVFICVCRWVCAISFFYHPLSHFPYSPNVEETQRSFCVQAAMWSSRIILTRGWPGLPRWRKTLGEGSNSDCLAQRASQTHLQPSGSFTSTHAFIHLAGPKSMAAPSGLPQVSGPGASYAFYIQKTKARKEKLCLSSDLMPKQAWLIDCEGMIHEEFTGQSCPIIYQIIFSHLYSYLLY